MTHGGRGEVILRAAAEPDFTGPTLARAGNVNALRSFGGGLIVPQNWRSPDEAFSYSRYCHRYRGGFFRFGLPTKRDRQHPGPPPPPGTNQPSGNPARPPGAGA